MTVRDDAHRTARIVSVIAGTVIALACGTNYAYSAWAPAFAERMRLSATESNIIGNAGNVGMYASGIPMGILIDSKGPKWGVLIGSVCLGLGYFPLYSAYSKGPGSLPVWILCIASLFTGMGSCSAFSGAIKTCATNWPQHRGTATAFPLSGFGLSAFAFTTIGGLAFPDDTGNLLLLLAVGTFCLTFTAMFFLRLIPPVSAYHTVPADEARRPSYVRADSNELLRSHSKHGRTSSRGVGGLQQESHDDADETSSLVSGPGDLPDHDKSSVYRGHHSHRSDITGVALIKNGAFWKLFIMLGLLCGVGLMTINNIGNDAKALWTHYDGRASHDFIQKRQLMHVGILSVLSFVGRLASGIGSDYVVKNLHSSRFWSLVASSLIFTLAQVVALNLQSPNLLFWLSGLTGLAYGALFGVYPALVADAFGASGMGINWGAMTMAPVLSGNIFNLVYGRIYDSHSKLSGGESLCLEGKACYSDAYILTLVAAALGVAWSLYCVRHEWMEKRAERRAMDEHEG